MIPQYQSLLMALVALLCWLSALDWLLKGVYPNAATLAAFGLGYASLAWAFWSTTP